MGHKVKQSLMSSRIDFFYYAFRNVLLVSVPLLVVCAFILGFSASHSSATDSDSNSGSDNITLTLSTSCTLSSSIIAPHHASLNGGQYEEGIGDTRINTYCNDNNGYSIYAIGTSNNVDGNTDLVSNLDEHYNIHTGAYANGNNIDTSTPSFWGMKLTPGVGTGSISELTPPTIMNSYNSYNVIPSSYTLVASRTSGTNMTIDTNITGSYFNTTYNIYASSVQPAGSYEGKVKYVMIHPGRDHNNIGFNEAFALSGKSSVGNYYAMQDMDVNICNMVNIYDEPSQTQLVDIRDGKTYWVAKLKDRHCWMTQNLDLDLVTYTNEQGQEVMKPLTSEDTDLTDHSLTGAYSETNGYSYDENTDIITWAPASTAKTVNFYNSTVVGWGNSYTAPFSASKIDNDDTGHFSLGNYYSWATAVASNNVNGLSGNASNSICPRNWRLPNTSNHEFSIINNLYNGTLASDSGLISAPLWFIKPGDINSGNLENYAAQGSYWSSTVRSNGSANALYLGNNKVDPAGETTGGNKRLGFPVRCMAR